jgi:hypothetical protein
LKKANIINKKPKHKKYLLEITNSAKPKQDRPQLTPKPARYSSHTQPHSRNKPQATCYSPAPPKQKLERKTTIN